MELVRNSAIYHSMGPLSSWPLLLTLLCKKSGGWATNESGGGFGSTNQIARFSQQPSNRLAISEGAAGGNREGRCVLKHVDWALECLSILIHSRLIVPSIS